MPYYVVQHMKISVRLNCLSIEHHELPSSSCLPSCLKLLLRLSRWIILSILDFRFSISQLLSNTGYVSLLPDRYSLFQESVFLIVILWK